jgi:hypothetical protein
MAKERTSTLLDAVDELLRETQEPIHYKELTKIMIGSGLWADPWGKEPDQILYSLMHNEVKRYGQGGGRFLFMGGGIFCTTFMEGLDELVELLPTPSANQAQRDPYARPGDMPGEADARRRDAEAAEADRRCGNCAHLAWDGPNLHKHEVGSCSMYSQTGRACVFKSSEPCGLWKRRTRSQVEADAMLPRKLVTEAEHVRLTGVPSRIH